MDDRNPPIGSMGRGHVSEPGPGVLDLSRHPLLCHAPAQWGDGVRVASNGTPVADICRRARAEPDYARLAAEFGITPAEAVACVAFGVEAGMVSVAGE
jgi:hypothetical protein